jgi:hypothetical protein
MRLPDEPVERDIMFRERFRVYDEFFTESADEAPQEPLYVTAASLKRKVAAPWWIVDTIVKTTRYTRDCPNIDRGASIRGSIKALDHTYSATEMRGGRVSSLGDAAEGLQLALRGRVRLRADLIGFDDRESEQMSQTAKVVDDVLWYAVRDVGERILTGLEESRALSREVSELLSDNGTPPGELESYPAFGVALEWMNETGPEELEHLVTDLEDQLRGGLAGADPRDVEEYRRSALELLGNALLAKEAIRGLPDIDGLYVPRRMET